MVEAVDIILMNYVNTFPFYVASILKLVRLVLMDLRQSSDDNYR